MAESDPISGQRDWSFLSGVARLEVCPAGGELIRQGMPAREMLFVESGLVKISHIDEDGDESIIDLRSSGHVLCIAAAILGGRYTFTAKALTDCQVRRVRVEDLFRKIASDPEFSRLLHLAQSREILASLTLMTRIARWSARRRFEHLLRSLGSSRTPHSAPLRVYLPLKQWELAQLLAVTPAHLSRMLSRMEADGALERHSGNVFVLRTAPSLP